MPALPHSPKDQHTLGHFQCPACEAFKRMIVRTGYLGDLTFEEVWPLWFEEKVQQLSDKTATLYRYYFRKLNPFFGPMPLKTIHIGNIVAYRSQRLTTTGPGCINHEINALKQVLEHAGLWAKIAKHYKQLPLPRVGPGSVITDQEAEWLFEVAQTNPMWRLAYLSALVSVNTGAGQSEVLSLRLRDVDFEKKIVSFVEHTKTKQRVRRLPMNEDCFWALREIELFGRERGAEAPDHYLFPKRAKDKNSKPDPTKHMESNRTAWKKLRTQASVRYPSLKYLGRYRLRHYALTKIAENPDVSEMTAKEIAGHGPYSKIMIEHYVDIRMNPKRVAMDGLQGLRKEPAKKSPASVKPSDRKESIQ